MRFSKVFAAALAVAASGAAFAQTTTLTTISLGPVPVVLSEVSVNGGLTYSQSAGLEYVVASSNPAATFAAFCLEPTVNYFGSGPATFNVSSFSSDVANSLSKLFTGAGWSSSASDTDAVDTALERVGLALAVWDIAADGMLDFGTGAFRATANDGFGGAAIAFAQAAYAAGNTSMADGILLNLTSTEYQDLVVAVPEPSTYALLIAGLAGVGFVARRRQNRA